jgi:hypothetical protein
MHPVTRIQAMAYGIDVIPYSVGMEGLEPSTFRVSGEYSNQLSYIPWWVCRYLLKRPYGSPPPALFLKVIAPLAGFEPTTLELTALCSTAELKGNKLHSVRESNPMSMQGFGGLPLP